MKITFVKVLRSRLLRKGSLLSVLALQGSFGFLRDAFADPTEGIRSHRLCFLSDLNGAYGSINPPASVSDAVNSLRRLQCGLVVGAGDLVAGQDPSLSESQLRLMWEGFRQFVLRPLDEMDVPVFTALGNHDASAARNSSGGYLFERERRVASEFWNKRRNQLASNKIDWLDDRDYPFFYSVRYGTVGIIFIDGSSATEIRAKRSWLENQLHSLAADASVSTRIVVGHLPLVAVAVGRDRPGEILADSRELYELFDAHKVDFYVSGHHHSFYPGRVEQWSRNHGTVQIALGALGDGPRKLLGQHMNPPRNSLSFLDIDESMPSSELKFSLSTFFPRTGEYLSNQDLPAMLPSVDGSGRFLPLKRVDFRAGPASPFP